jgi:HAE1 family hydrophobic/amphiphilic exporter-1
MPGVDARVGWSDDGGRPGNVVSYDLRGEDTLVLIDLAEEAARRIEAVSSVIGVQVDLEEQGGPELQLQVDREAAARYGQAARTVGHTVSFAMRGQQLPDLLEDEREVSVYAGFRIEDRADMSRLLDFPMWSAVTGQAVPLRALVTESVVNGLGSIYRRDRMTGLSLRVDLATGVELADAESAIDGVLGSMVFPRGYRWEQGRRFEEHEEDERARNHAFALSVTFVFLIMGVLFESLLLPLAILTTIPMALLGVYWTLFLTGTSLDVMGGVGLVVLVGVVVNNGIVLVDLVTRLRLDGRSRTEALIEAGGRRLRPILMTALTTIFGLLPMAAGSSSFVGLSYAPLGRVVLGGLAAGTVLTLFLVPFLYSLLDDVRASGGRWLAWVLGGPEQAGRVEEGGS